MKKIVFSIFVTILGFFVPANADTYSGSCGDTMTWSLNTDSGNPDEGILYIKGSGDMAKGNTSPWNQYRLDIKKIVFEGEIKSIGNSAFFECGALTSVDIPNSVTSIGNNAFYGCGGLTRVEIPNSVTSIGYSAFQNCNSLNRVDISDMEAWCKINFSTASANPLSYAHNLYLNGDLVTDLKIPLGVSEIKNYAFYNCYSISSVEIPNSVTSIGDQAFRDCHELKSVEIPNSVTSIGDSAFWGCEGLTTIKIPNSITSIENNAFRYCSALTSIEIPNSVTSIGQSAFSECSALTSIEIPNSVTKIGAFAFVDCTSLTRVDISDMEAWCKIEFGGAAANPLYHAHNLYLNGDLITDLKIPLGISEIKDYAFENCTSISSVEIPNSVTSIGRAAFERCSALTSIKIPNSITSIEAYTFNLCSALTSINIPNSVTKIGSSAFQDCTGLTNVTIPNSVTEIDGNAFCRCSALTNIYNYAKEPPTIVFYTFYDVDKSKITLYVIEGYEDAYRNAKDWKEFENIVGIPDPDNIPEPDGEEQEFNIHYLNIDGDTTHQTGATIKLPIPEELEGYEFSHWEVVGGRLDDGIQIQAVYNEKTEVPTSVTEIEADQNDTKVKKVLRNGQIYVIKGDKVFNLAGVELN